MKIVIVAPYFYPKVGGVEAYTYQIARQYAGKGASVTVITSQVKDTAAYEQLDGMDVYRLRPLVRVSNTPINPLWYWRIKKILKQIRPDVVHVHAPVPFMGDVAARTCSNMRIPYVVTYHSGSMKKGSKVADAIIGLYETYMLPRMLAGAARITSVYPSFIEQRYPQFKGRVVFTPPAVDSALFKPAARGRAASVPTVLYVGRIDKTSAWKGIGTLLEAMKAAVAANPDIQLKLVGPGDAMQDYAQQAERIGIAGHITFAGGLFGGHLVRAYQEATVLVLPSETDAESFGMVLIEAMACGTPVIGTRVGGMQATIESTGGGLLVAPRSPKELASAIQRIVSDSQLRAELATAGRSAVKKTYQWSKLAATFMDVYDQAIRADRTIVHIAGYYPPHLGGMEQVVEEMVTRLDSAGYRQQVITSVIGSQGLPRRQMVGNSIIRRLRSFFIANTPVMPGLFLALWRTPKHALFHVHVAQAGIPEIALLVGKVRRIPVVMHVHADVEASGPMGAILPFYKKILLGPVLRHASQVVVLTDVYKTLLQEKYSLPMPPAVIPNGVDERFYMIAKPRRNAGHPTKILFVGRLSVEKNVDLLIAAVQSIEEPTIFTIVGDGPLFDDLAAKARAARTKHCQVTLVGRRTHEEVTAYYHSHDIFVLASDYESQSLVVLEALASSMPVIVPKLATLQEVIGDAALYVHATPNAFAQAITDLAHNGHKAHDLSTRAYQKAQEYSWTRSLRKFQEMYKAI